MLAKELLPFVQFYREHLADLLFLVGPVLLLLLLLLMLFVVVNVVCCLLLLITTSNCSRTYDTYLRAIYSCLAREALSSFFSLWP